jgi:hypothetical protein
MNWGMKNRVKDLLLVTGSGRNVGKTTFICQVIAHQPLKKFGAIKITSHFHEPSPGLIPVLETPNFRIFEETNIELGKDTSRYLRAGAVKSYYIQTDDAHLRDAFNLTSVLFDPDLPFLVESARLRQILSPELFIFIQGTEDIEDPFSIEMREKADITVFSDKQRFSFHPDNIYFNRQWRVEEHDLA